MFHLIIFSITLIYHFGAIKGQNGGVNPATEDRFVCVPPGFCNNANPAPPPPGIDPRIVTPQGGPCPSGLIPCTTQGPNSLCGVRFVQQPTGDGPTQPGVYPWQVYLRNATNAYAGSGVLLDNYHILTAAHKVFLSQCNPSTVTAFMGVYNPAQINVNTQNRTVQSISIFNQPQAYLFNSSTLFNDLAILRVAQPFALSQPNINTACLPPAGASFVGQSCVVAGWGETRFGLHDDPTNPMKQVFVNVVDANTCRNALANPAVLGASVNTFFDPAGEICAGGQPMRDACTGDGGAPLICPATGGRGVIAGLVIWGKNCGQPGVYGVYVNVPQYRAWIDQQLNAFYMG